MKKLQPQMPENWEPPVPAWSADLQGDVTIAYLAAQHFDKREALKGLSAIRTFLDCEEGAFHVDLAISEVEGSHFDAFAIAYFDGTEAFHRWASSSGFDAWWAHDGRLNDFCGYWQERIVLPAERIESLHSSPSKDGFSHKTELKGPVREHNYWGGMRDRIALSQFDLLESPVSEPLRRTENGSGQRIVVKPPLNLCVIRSGQDLTDCTQAELETYDSIVKPELVAGMSYLAKDGLSIGCAAARYATEMSPDGTPLRRTFGQCVFLSLEQLEIWAKSHPTHLAIFKSFFELLKVQNNEISLRLWHEVAVLPSDGQHFEYLNCAPQTGISGLFQQPSFNAE